MAHTNTKPANQQPNAPEFLAWHVEQNKPQVCLPSSKNSNNARALLRKGKKSFWNKVGAAWRHKDGKGYTLQLEEPTNGDGKNENGSA